MNDNIKEKKIKISTIKENERLARKKVAEFMEHREKVNSGEIMEADGWWQEIFLNWLKQQAFVFIGETLREFKKTGIKWAVDFSNWLLSELESIIVNLYNSANIEEKETFKNKMVEVFPNSSIINKLN